MRNPVQLLYRPIWAAAILAACLATPLAFAAGPGATGNHADIEARYQSDIALCNSGKSAEDKKTCLREAGAAREEALRNRLGNGNQQALSANETARCKALPTEQRDDCLLQMSGKDTVSQGSVNAGGILRETTIPVPAK
ncbi:hypothetical protein H0A66_05830 [Alcaligenaceae bacterium]|nr:hypothetical protein [Alcaligenaceae bacterium]